MHKTITFYPGLQNGRLSQGHEGVYAVFLIFFNEIIAHWFMLYTMLTTNP
jgi:hypothetical protein